MDNQLMIGNVYKVNGLSSLMIYIKDYDKENLVMFDRTHNINRIIPRNQVGELVISIISDSDREHIIRKRIIQLLDIIKNDPNIKLNATLLSKKTGCKYHHARNILNSYRVKNTPDTVIKFLVDLTGFNMDDVLDCYNNSPLDVFE